MKKFILTLISISFLVALFACNPARGSVIETRQDGPIKATIMMDREQFSEGEPVLITFTIENTSENMISLQRGDAVVQEIILSSGSGERYWSQEEGQPINELDLSAGEQSTLEWDLGELDRGVYTAVGRWWSLDEREIEVVVIFEYGPVRY